MRAVFPASDYLDSSGVVEILHHSLLQPTPRLHLQLIHLKLTGSLTAIVIT